MDLAIFLKGHTSCSPGNCVSPTSIKCKNIATYDCKPSFAIEDYYFYSVENVEGVGVQPRENYGWDVAYNTISGNGVPNYYFCVDTIYNDTWPHWVDESAIYLLLFAKLKKIYQTIKLYSFSKKNYKKAMYKAFDISEEEVVHTLEGTNNTFIFPEYISLADHRKPFLFMKHMANFYNYIAAKCPTKEKDIDILYLPRGKKENSKGTDRTIPVQPMLIEFLSQLPTVKIFYTDDTENMIDQWDLVRRAKVIILNEGGNHGINGFFAYNSQILVLGGNGNACHFQNPSPGLMYYDSLKRGNKYYHISYEYPMPYILDLLQNILLGAATPVGVPKFSCFRNCNYCKYQEYEKY